MKKKIILSLTVVLLIQITAFAQTRHAKHSFVEPVISEYEITDIEAGQGIDLLLLQGDGQGLSASVDNNGLNKVKIDLNRGKLRLAKKPGMPKHDRITVYIHINGALLKSLKLSDDAFATSRGILDINFMDIKLEDNARIALRTRGKLKVNVPVDHELMEEEKYYSVYSVGK